MITSLSLREKIREPLRSISDSLCEVLEREDVPSEEHVRRFLREIADSICQKDVSPEQLENLAWLTETFYNYSDFDENEERFFCKAACWAAVVIYRDAKDELIEQENFESLKSLVEAYADVFDVVEENPGIGHSELAKRLDKSISRQSQIMSNLVDRGLISSVKRGRNKDYYVTKKAKDLKRKAARNDFNLFLRYTEERIQTAFSQEFHNDDGGSNAKTEMIIEAQRRTVEAKVANSNQSSFLGVAPMPDSWDNSALCASSLFKTDQNIEAAMI